VVLAMLGVAAKLERRRIKERTSRGRVDDFEVEQVMRFTPWPEFGRAPA